jgi:hypothetical protein
VRPAAAARPVGDRHAASHKNQTEYSGKKRLALNIHTIAETVLER